MNAKTIRRMIEDGASDADIQRVLDQTREAAFEARADREDYLARFGDEFEDGLSAHEREMCDRLDMGRNDAGEWLGFM